MPSGERSGAPRIDRGERMIAWIRAPFRMRHETRREVLYERHECPAGHRFERELEIPLRILRRRGPLEPNESRRVDRVEHAVQVGIFRTELECATDAEVELRLPEPHRDFFRIGD